MDDINVIVISAPTLLMMRENEIVLYIVIISKLLTSNISKSEGIKRKEHLRFIKGKHFFAPLYFLLLELPPSKLLNEKRYRVNGLLMNLLWHFIF